MGLDITAYSQLEFIEIITDPDRFEETYPFLDKEPYGYQDLTDGTFVCHITQAAGFSSEWNAPLIENGVYRLGVYRLQGTRFEFRVGPYSYYNKWRRWLSQSLLGVAPEEVWNNFPLYNHHPVAWLINFSDCQGVIGSDLAKRIYPVMLEALPSLPRPEVTDDDEEDVDEYREQYASWLEAFRLAAENGGVGFG